MIELINGEGTIEQRIPAVLRMFGKYDIDIRKEPTDGKLSSGHHCIRKSRRKMYSSQMQGYHYWKADNQTYCGICSRNEEEIKMDNASILETIMIISFGVSWPLSIFRSYRSRSTKGKSLLFMCFILFGYFCGIASKYFSGTYNLAFFFYFPNVIMVSADIFLYFRNKKIEAANNAQTTTPGSSSAKLS